MHREWSTDPRSNPFDNGEDRVHKIAQGKNIAGLGKEKKE